MSTFEYTTTPSVICGPGSVKKAGGLAKERLQASRVLVVSDSGLEECGLLERLLSGLRKAGLEFQVCLDISSDPLEAEILKGAAADRHQSGAHPRPRRGGDEA